MAMATPMRVMMGIAHTLVAEGLHDLDFLLDRERVVRAVVKGGLSRHQAAAQFGVGISTAINWVQRFHETGSVAPSQIGGYRPKKIAGPHREWLLQRCRKDFTVRGLVAELAERGLKVDYRTMWEFVHAVKLSYKKRR